jgi:hypothetical protein
MDQISDVRSDTYFRIVILPFLLKRSLTVAHSLSPLSPLRRFAASFVVMAKSMQSMKVVKGSKSKSMKVVKAMKVLGQGPKIKNVSKKFKELAIAFAQAKAKREDAKLKEIIFLEIPSTAVENIKIKISRGDLINDKPIFMSQFFGDAHEGRLRFQLKSVPQEGQVLPLVDWVPIKRIE